MPSIEHELSLDTRPSCKIRLIRSGDDPEGRELSRGAGGGAAVCDVRGCGSRAAGPRVVLTGLGVGRGGGAEPASSRPRPRSRSRVPRLATSCDFSYRVCRQNGQTTRRDARRVGNVRGVNLKGEERLGGVSWRFGGVPARPMLRGAGAAPADAHIEFRRTSSGVPGPDAELDAGVTTVCPHSVQDYLRDNLGSPSRSPWSWRRATGAPPPSSSHLSPQGACREDGKVAPHVGDRYSYRADCLVEPLVRPPRRPACRAGGQRVPGDIQGSLESSKRVSPASVAHDEQRPRSSRHSDGTRQRAWPLGEFAFMRSV